MATPSVTHFNELTGTIVPITLTQETGAAVTALGRFQVPFDYDVYAVSASTRAQAGAAPTVDVQVAAVSVLTAPISITAQATTYLGTLIAAATTVEEKAGAYAKATDITVNTTIGTSYSGLTVVIYLKKKN